MKLAPKFKQWVDDLTKIEGIIGYNEHYEIQIDSNKTVVVDIDVTRRAHLDYDLIKKVVLYGNLKVNTGNTIKPLSLDEAHKDYLSNKLTILMQQNDLQSWIGMYKAKKRSDYLQSIDNYF